MSETEEGQLTSFAKLPAMARVVYSDSGKTVTLSTAGVPPVITGSIKLGVLLGDMARLRLRAGTFRMHASLDDREVSNVSIGQKSEFVAARDFDCLKSRK